MNSRSTVVGVQDRDFRLDIRLSKMFENVMAFEEGISNLKSPPMLNFLYLYFNYAFAFCLSPFRFSWDKVTGTNIVREWLPQKILCLIAHSITILILIRDLHSKILQSSTVYYKNPVKYFQLIDSIFNFAYKFTLIKRLWWNRRDFVRIMDFITSQKCLHHTKTRLQHPIYIHVLLIFYTLIGILSLIAGKNFISGLPDWSIEWWMRRLVTYSRYIFYIDPGTVMKKGAPELNELTAWEISLALLMVFGLVTRFLLGFFIDLSILISTITLWSGAASFAKSIEFDPFQKWMVTCEQPSTLKTVTKVLVQRKTFDYGQVEKDSQLMSLKWQKIYSDYYAIRVLAYLINKALGSLVVWFVLEALMYYSVNMDAFLITKDYFKRLYLFGYYVGTAAIFTFSSEVCMELEVIKAWLSEDENRIGIPNGDVNLILHEMVSKDVGIRGWGAFTITYPLFASFVGTIITFFIICIEQTPA